MSATRLDPRPRQPSGQRPRAPIVLAIVAAVVAGGASLSACRHRVPGPDLSMLTSADATARLIRSGERRERLSGLLVGRLGGLGGAVASVSLDVAVEPQARLTVSVRSFFEQPQQVLVTDGTMVTLFDATTGVPRFFRGPVTDQTLMRLLPLPLRPEDIVSVLLARPALDSRGRLVRVDDDNGTFELMLEAPGRGPMQVTVRASDDTPLRMQLFRPDGRRLVDVTLDDVRVVDGVPAPHRWTFVVPGDKPQEIVLRASDVVLNGPPLPPEAFVLEPPPGAVVMPL